MAVDISVNLNVPPLPPSGIWFANNAAWNNYFSAVDGTAVFPGAATSIYVPSAYNGALQPYVLNVDGIATNLATQAMVNSLIAQVAALDASYQALRSEMKAAGYISQAQ